MIRKIKAGRHRSNPPTFALYFNKKVFRKTITFDVSCRYQVDPEDDVNKLWGVSFFSPKILTRVAGLKVRGPLGLPFVVDFGHHQDSARFGWRYNAANDKIEVLSYCYCKGQRFINHICFVDFDKPIEYIIMVGGDGYRFIVDAYYFTQQCSNYKKFQYALGFYFGGQSTASHDMKIEIT